MEQITKKGGLRKDRGSQQHLSTVVWWTYVHPIKPPGSSPEGVLFKLSIPNHIQMNATIKRIAGESN